MLKRLLSILKNEPLVHFLCIAVVLYVLIKLTSPESLNTPANTIVIDKNALIAQMQINDQVFDPARYQAKFAALDDTAQQRLIDQVVRQEVLIDAAKNAGLDQHDQVIRRRLIQSMTFSLQNLANHDQTLSEAQVAAYFADNQPSYQSPATVSFEHLFFKINPQQAGESLQRAQQQYQQINKADSLADYRQNSDAFVSAMRFSAQSQDKVARRFGDGFATALFAQLKDKPLGDSVLLPPMESVYGHHVVLVTDSQARRSPELAAVYQQVYRDAKRAQLKQQLEQRIQQLIASYQVVIELDD